jgi:hypothetical protein
MQTRKHELNWGLEMRSSSIEEGRRGMSKVTLRHKVVSLENFINVSTMNANSDTHNHMLGTFSHTTINVTQI